MILKLTCFLLICLGIFISCTQEYEEPNFEIQSDNSSNAVSGNNITISGRIIEQTFNFVGKEDIKIGDKVSEGSVLATIENGQAASAPKEEKIVKEAQPQEKPKTNGEINQVRQVKKVFAEPASKDDIDPIETNEWIDSLNSVIENDGSSRASYLLNKVIDQAYKSGLVLPDTRTTPYINTIPPEAEIKSPGDQNIEKKIRAYVRWLSLIHI